MKVKTIVIGIVLGILAVIGFYVWTIQRWESSSYVEEIPPDPSVAPPDQETDIEEREHFAATMRQHLQNKDYSTLEKLGQGMITSRERFAGGDWKLLRFYEALDKPQAGGNEDDWKLLITNLEEWTKQYPDSIVATVALGKAHIKYAWNARGSAFSSEVTSEGRAGFEDRLNRAEQILMKKYDQRKQCVAWFDAMQWVAIGKSLDRAKATQLFEEGAALEPQYHELYYSQACYLLPRWYGNSGDWERFANETSKKMGGIEGSILYSDICWRISRMYSDFFKENDVDWDRIKQGFSDREKVYGKSYRYLNALTLMATKRQDRAMCRALFARMGEHWEPDFWSEKKYFDDWRTWATATGS